MRVREIQSSERSETECGNQNRSTHFFFQRAQQVTGCVVPQLVKKSKSWSYSADDEID